jgi:hypothetical protein
VQICLREQERRSESIHCLPMILGDNVHGRPRRCFSLASSGRISLAAPAGRREAPLTLSGVQKRDRNGDPRAKAKDRSGTRDTYRDRASCALCALVFFSGVHPIKELSVF